MSSFSLDSCAPEPVCESKTYTFENMDRITSKSTYLGDASKTDWVMDGQAVTYNNNVLLTMAPQTVGTVLASSTYLWYGNVKATFKTSRGQGVVTAFILLSDVKDEIDYEFVGTDLGTAQSNFYFQGITDCKFLSQTLQVAQLRDRRYNEERLTVQIITHKISHCPTPSKTSTLTKSTGPPTKLPGLSTAKSAVSRSSLTLGMRHRINGISRKRQRASSFPFGLVVSQAMRREQLPGLVGQSIGTRSISRRAAMTMRRSSPLQCRATMANQPQERT